MSTDPLYSERERAWLLDIADNAELASEFVEGASIQRYRNDRKMKAATERAVARATEAAHRLGERGPALVPGEDWRRMRGMGNVLRHEYDHIVDELIYGVATVDLPRLRRAIVELLGDDYRPLDTTWDPNIRDTNEDTS